jgi:subtilisin family serine protease
MSEARPGVRLVAGLALAMLLPACAPPVAERKGPDWSYVGTKVPKGWWYDRVDVGGARAKAATGAAVTIAILDTGVEVGDPDLPRAQGAATCGSDPADFADRRGHGTQVAGIALGKDPGRATRGLAPDAALLAIKIDCGLVTPTALVQGVDRALQARPAVLLLTLGGYPPNAARALEDRVRHHRDVLFVVASVWDGATHPLPAWTRLDNALVVAAMTLRDGSEIPYDGRGGDIAAPGRDVETADLGEGQYLMQGTSAAAAIAAGCAALVKQKTGLAAPAVRSALLAAAEPGPYLPARRLNCARAIP